MLLSSRILGGALARVLGPVDRKLVEGDGDLLPIVAGERWEVCLEGSATVAGWCRSGCAIGTESDLESGVVRGGCANAQV